MHKSYVVIHFKIYIVREEMSGIVDVYFSDAATHAHVINNHCSCQLETSMAYQSIMRISIKPRKWCKLKVNPVTVHARMRNLGLDSPKERTEFFKLSNNPVNRL